MDPTDTDNDHWNGFAGRVGGRIRNNSGTRGECKKRYSSRSYGSLSEHYSRGGDGQSDRHYRRERKEGSGGSRWRSGGEKGRRSPERKRTNCFNHSQSEKEFSVIGHCSSRIGGGDYGDWDREETKQKFVGRPGCGRGTSLKTLDDDHAYRPRGGGGSKRNFSSSPERSSPAMHHDVKRKDDIDSGDGKCSGIPPLQVAITNGSGPGSVASTEGVYGGYHSSGAASDGSLCAPTGSRGRGRRRSHGSLGEFVSNRHHEDENTSVASTGTTGGGSGTASVGAGGCALPMPVLLPGESRFPHASYATSETAKSDIATICSGSVVDEMELASVMSCDLNVNTSERSVTSTSLVGGGGGGPGAFPAFGGGASNVGTSAFATPADARGERMQSLQVTFARKTSTCSLAGASTTSSTDKHLLGVEEHLRTEPPASAAPAAPASSSSGPPPLLPSQHQGGGDSSVGGSSVGGGSVGHGNVSSLPNGMHPMLNDMGPPLSRVLLRAGPTVAKSGPGSTHSSGSGGLPSDLVAHVDTDDAGSVAAELDAHSVHSTFSRESGLLHQHPRSPVHDENQTFGEGILPPQPVATLSAVASKARLENGSSGRTSPGGTVYKGRGVRRYQGRYMHLPLKRFHQNTTGTVFQDSVYTRRSRSRSPQVSARSWSRSRSRSSSRSRSRSRSCSRSRSRSQPRNHSRSRSGSRSRTRSRSRSRSRTPPVAGRRRRSRSVSPRSRSRCWRSRSRSRSLNRSTSASPRHWRNGKYSRNDSSSPRHRYRCNSNGTGCRRGGRSNSDSPSR